MFKYGELVNQRIIAIKGIKEKGRKLIRPSFLLFDDKKTFIELSEQDYYSYHDASFSAREIEIRQDFAMWKNLYEDNAHFPNANSDY